jgi:poly-gamma-glutamate capsule biosynthesis protein CapA/YwtB (metallophosphatase superfamily)
MWQSVAEGRRSLRRSRVERASAEDAKWLEEHLNREARNFGTRIESQRDGTYALDWT